MRVLITGGTGTLGQALTQHFLREGAERVVVFSRDEQKQAVMGAAITHPHVRFFLGDVRDRDRLSEALHGIDTLVHAAALKRVDALASHPGEVRRTNIEGSANVIRCAIGEGVRRVLMISSDKACLPTNIYGVTKSAMEWEAVASNALSVPRGTAVACVRYGNVLGSRGSVVHLFRQRVADGRPLLLTHREMTRFWITVDEAVALVSRCLGLMVGGEIFVPVLPAMRLVDLAEAVAPGHPTQVVGLRPGGEKLHEVLINEDEARRTVAVDDTLWCIRPEPHAWRADDPWQGEPFPSGFVYQSDRVGWRLSVADMRKLLESVP